MSNARRIVLIGGGLVILVLIIYLIYQMVTSFDRHLVSMRTDKPSIYHLLQEDSSLFRSTLMDKIKVNRVYLNDHLNPISLINYGKYSILFAKIDSLKTGGLPDAVTLQSSNSELTPGEDYKIYQNPPYEFFVRWTPKGNRLQRKIIACADGASRVTFHSNLVTFSCTSRTLALKYTSSGIINFFLRGKGHGVWNRPQKISMQLGFLKRKNLVYFFVVTEETNSNNIPEKVLEEMLQWED